TTRPSAAPSRPAGTGTATSSPPTARRRRTREPARDCGTLEPVPPTELTERRRTEIVHAAFAEFAERGYHNTRIADIPRRLGIGHGTFYRYFANKRDILVHVLDHTVGRLRAVVARDAPGAAETLTEYRAQVRRIGYAMFDLFVDDPQLMRMCFVEPMSVDAE